MCGMSHTDKLSMIRDGRISADEILSGLGIPIQKAMNLSTARGFDSAVSQLAGMLRRFAGRSESEALRAAIGGLDVDWHSMKATERSALVNRALANAGRALSPVHERIRVPLGRAANEVFRATRQDSRRRGLSIGADFNAVDRRAVRYVTRANCLFVRDEYGRRVEGLGREAKRIVAQGLERGLGREDIAQDLAQAAESSLVRRASSYWEVVAASFVGESRSLSQISSYAEAGIERYVISAVLDEHTTDTCRFLDGKVLETGEALRRFERLEASDDPMAIKNERPWVREKVGEDGKTRLFAGESVLAQVERSGYGARDDRGEFSRGLSGKELAPLGVGFPPFHGMCRSNVVPDI